MSEYLQLRYLAAPAASVTSTQANTTPYRNPEWFSHPQGTVAYEFQGALAAAARAPSSATSGQQDPPAPGEDVEVQVRKPSGHSGH